MPHNDGKLEAVAVTVIFAVGLFILIKYRPKD
jgi:hypothetical protein